MGVPSSKERPKGYAERYALAYAKRYPLGLASRRAPRDGFQSRRGLIPIFPSINTVIILIFYQ